jgi:sterol desaturase/sphingolipid hydroxylase (fatty acid hydroxylase superfamily)
MKLNAPTDIYGFLTYFFFFRDNFLILQCMIGATAFCIFPSLRQLPSWNLTGVAVAILLHVAISEPLYYWAHRGFHRGSLYSNYHYLHHSIRVPQPFTGLPIKKQSLYSLIYCLKRTFRE